jgi:hypothetical protein
MVSFPRVALLGTLVAGLTFVACMDGGESANQNSRSEQRLTDLGLVSGPPMNLVEACKEVARLTSLATVYCPPVVPEGAVTVEEQTGLFGGGREGRATYFFTLTSGSLAGRDPDIRDPLHKGHWVFYAGRPARSVELGVYATRRDARNVPSFVVKGVRAEVLTGDNAGLGWASQSHAIVYWKVGNTGYVVSVHGEANAPLAKAMANGLIREMVGCTPHDVKAQSRLCDWAISAT